MLRHHENSLKVAEALSANPHVLAVHHPLLASNASRALALAQHAGLHSGVVTIEVKGGRACARKALTALKVFSCAVSLGGAHSVASHPPSMSHSFLGDELCAKIGIRPGTLRLSCGLENAQDLIRDLEQALEASQQ